jgi:hypothetical protein
MELSVSNLNAITRSYNLMAPELAKRPYFSLQRELDNCYAEVAPLVADTIRERATRPAKSLADINASTHRTIGIWERFGADGKSAKIYDSYHSKKPHYGLREMWRDFRSGSK